MWNLCKFEQKDANTMRLSNLPHACIHLVRDSAGANVDRGDPANASIVKGATQQYTATGTYSDASL